MQPSWCHLVKQSFRFAGEASGEAPMSEEDAAQVRAQLDVRLREAAAAEGADSDGEALAHGREVWARCEALTAGASFGAVCPKDNCQSLDPE